MKRGKLLVSLFYIFILVFIDQITKYLIRSRGGFYICNSGVAFGIKISPILFWAILILIAVVFLYYSAKSEIRSASWRTKSEINSPPKADQPWAEKFKIKNWTVFILSGGIANMIDRWQFGCVVDFIDLKFWPVFNLADAFITIGVALLLAKYLKKCYNNSEKER
jgi:signal peptidase II